MVDGREVGGIWRPDACVAQGRTGAVMRLKKFLSTPWRRVRMLVARPCPLSIRSEAVRIEGEKSAATDPHSNPHSTGRSFP